MVDVTANLPDGEELLKFIARSVGHDKIFWSRNPLDGEIDAIGMWPFTLSQHRMCHDSKREKKKG